MSDAPKANNARAAFAADPNEERAEWRTRTLRELAELGTDLARSLQRQAAATGLTATSAAELERALARIATEVRLTNEMAARLERLNQPRRQDGRRRPKYKPMDTSGPDAATTVH